MKYVSYYRVSTQKQGQSGLGLEAQQAAVHSYILHNGNQLIAEFTEVESGKMDRRPELTQAILTAKENDATLVIAKLDRLSRNMTFISKLMDNKIRFVCADMPEANELTIHVFAAVAQWERNRISERIREALRAKRQREPNWKQGTNNLTSEGRAKAWSTISRKAKTDQRTRHAFHFIKPLREQGMSYGRIAEELNAEGYLTRQGKQFQAMQVFNIYKRIMPTC